MRTGLPVLGSGRLLYGGLPWRGLEELTGYPFCSCPFPIETVSVQNLDQERTESIRQSATRRGTLLTGTPGGARREEV